MTGTITVAKDSSRSRLTCRAAASEPSGSSAGPPAVHHAWVQANTSSGADATVEMSCAACPGGAQQPDRGPELRTVSVPVDPPVPRVHGPVIMNAHRGEQRCVDRVIGVLTVTSFGVSWKAKTSSIWKPYSVQLTGQVIVAGGAR